MPSRTQSRQFSSAAVYSRVPFRMFRAASVGALSGALAGLFTLGFGLRLAMKLSAMAAGQDGAITDAQATVGEFSREGSAFLLIAGTSAGAAGGLIYAALSSALQPLARLRGLAFGLVLLAVAGSGVIDDGNPDFRRFGPPAFNVALFAVLFVAFGVVIAPVHTWLDRALGRTGTGPRKLRTVALLALGALFAVVSLFGPVIMLAAGNRDDGARPTIVVSLVLLIIVIWPAVGRLRTRVQVSIRDRAAAGALMFAPVLAGSTLLAISVARIITG